MSGRAAGDLRRQLAREQDRLARFDSERARTRERIAALRAQVAGLEVARSSRAGRATK